MPVIVDTCVWSLSLRRDPESLNKAELSVVEHLEVLIKEDRERVIGPIRQELLSGVREETQFEKLRNVFRDFDDQPLTTQDYELAAEIDCRCRKHGIAATAIDVLICAVAERRGWEVLTTDKDFERYSKVVELRVHAVP